MWLLVVIPTMFAAVIMCIYFAYKGLEMGNIHTITNESNKRIEYFLEKYPEDSILLEKYKINDCINNGYSSYEIEHIASKNISDSQLVVDMIYLVRLVYDDQTEKYKVTQRFTTFGTVEFYISNKELDNGTWTMEWKRESS